MDSTDPDVVVPAGQPNGDHRAGILGPLLPAPVQIHFVNLSALRLDAGNDVPQIVQRLEFHIDVHVPGAFDDGILHEGQQPVGQQDQQEAQKYALVKSRADGQTHTGGRPKARRRGQSLHLLLAGDDDGARTQKADAVDDLGAEAGHIRPQADLHGGLMPGVGHPIALILTEQHGQRRAHAYPHIGPEACRPALPLPLQSDEAPEEHGHSQAQQDGGHVHLPQVCQSFHHSVHTPLSAPRRAVKQ